jgi:16S rRNA (uracil1498-N3)-methyltransferase
MTERRFYVRPGDVADGRLRLGDDEAHHAKRVLRLEPGAEVTCFDGRGRLWLGAISSYTKHGAEVEIRSTSERPEPLPRIALAQGLVKGDRMDAIVQKATELGASAIWPLACSRSDVRLEPKRAESRRLRWERIVVEAGKQCERAWLPELDGPCGVADALGAALARGGAVAFVARGGEPALAALARHASIERWRAGERLTVFVGPEGGWAPEERELFESARVPFLSLGENVLRADTAAVAALAVVSAALRHQYRPR